MVSDATLVEIYLLKLWKMEMITHMPMREIVKEIMKVIKEQINKKIKEMILQEIDLIKICAS